ncbi:MAG: cell division protein ZapA [Deltaproteobacteria bacterium]|nr:cell division protein ZapA [Deltaproteobacteria bacterium]
MEKPVTVNILGNEYVIKSKEDAEQVYKIAEYMNEKVKEIDDNTEGLSEKKKVILVALNIAGDYFQVLKERDELLAGIRQRSRDLIDNINSTIS